MPELTILSFDIGIKNLAWCLMKRNTDLSGSQYQILGWENVNILTDGAATPTKVTCHKCSAKATHSANETLSCGRHCPAEFPAFRDLSGNALKKIPAMKELKVLFAQRGLATPKSKEDALKKLSAIFSMPVEVKKVKKAVDNELSVLHDGIRKMILERKALFAQAGAIHLENQPVLKNPTMKSVQILLFATLRDLLQTPTQPPPNLRLIHAGVKVKGVQAGDAGYKERKQGSEAAAKQLLAGTTVKDAATWKTFLEKHTKQNDLTDAFCMCINALT
jgi:hypothetical protein